MAREAGDRPGLGQRLDPGVQFPPRRTDLASLAPLVMIAGACFADVRFGLVVPEGGMSAKTTLLYGSPRGNRRRPRKTRMHAALTTQLHPFSAVDGEAGIMRIRV